MEHVRPQDHCVRVQAAHRLEEIVLWRARVPQHIEVERGARPDELDQPSARHSLDPNLGGFNRHLLQAAKISQRENGGKVFEARYS